MAAACMRRRIFSTRALEGTKHFSRMSSLRGSYSKRGFVQLLYENRQSSLRILQELFVGSTVEEGSCVNSFSAEFCL